MAFPTSSAAFRWFSTLDILLTVTGWLTLFSASVLAAETGQLSFEQQIAPLLEKYCTKCHGPETQEFDLRVDTLDPEFTDRRDNEFWHDILHVLNRGEMPPEDAQQPTDHERQAIVDWITAKLTQVAKAKLSTGGRGVIRRLTNYEYNNTMADLLGVKLDYAANLPPEAASKDGFKNNGQAMGMSSLQIEAYLRAAQLGLSKALVEGPPPEPYKVLNTVNMERRAGRKPKYPHTRFIQPGHCFMTRLMKYPVEGPVRVRVKAHAIIPQGKGPPRMRVMVGVRADTHVPAEQLGQEVDVTATAENPGIYEFTGRLEQFPMLSSPLRFPGMLVNVHNVYDDGSGAIDVIDEQIKGRVRKLNKLDAWQPWLVIDSVEFIAPDYQVWPPASHRSILFLGAETPTDETGYAKLVLERFMKRAYRRTPTDREVTDILNFYQQIRPQYPTFVQTMRQTLTMVLISPQFLYLVEPTDAEQGARDLTPDEVASRLSYFLWSTLPDDELFSLAASGQLLEPAVLRTQVKRMLAAPEAKRFMTQFTEQWLDLAALDRVAVNPQFYPKFSDRLKPLMRLETQLFFAEILNNNLSALNFIDSDFTMLSERLAKHYGVDGVRGNAFRRVALKPEHRRGGLITQASMLVGNSTGEDSHPILRAVWILERLLDDPPAPPPANVPALDPEMPGFDKLTRKEQLAVHRGNNACGSCHRKIDPWGIPLEQFDAAGLYRTKAVRLTAKKKGAVRDQRSTAPLDIVDTMPDGQMIEGVEQLKNYLLAEKEEEFSRALVVKMTAYALGRSLEITDQSVVDELTEDFKQSGHRLDHLISSIVTSELFLTK